MILDNCLGKRDRFWNTIDDCMKVFPSLSFDSFFCNYLISKSIACYVGLEFLSFT